MQLKVGPIGPHVTMVAAQLVVEHIMNKLKKIFLNFKDTGILLLSLTIYVDDKMVRMQIWDTAGQERYNALTKLYFKGANAAIIVYDVTDEESFAKAQRWSEQIDEFQQSEADI